MRNYIAAKATKVAAATAISAVCLGTGAVACFATMAAPAAVSASAATIIPNDSPWN
jgi:hypothetical protein